ncbi:MAG TPA: 1,2-phenylacetyl-CoA epoxidase subunit PaaD [Mycobacteriales bacterium]|nr:1,2-phenylacetyl-CoA epoxidase subunit PaaD [Mycobacteriales bacterium]
MSAAVATTANAWQILAGVADPEIPVVSVVDLGIVRAVKVSDDQRRVVVTLTPTYSGCPATEVIAHDVREALTTAYDEVVIDVQLSPAWTTEWLSAGGREKLRGFGIAPPNGRGVTADGRKSLPILEIGRPERCPSCGSTQLDELSRFGSTPCKSLWRCEDCREPFDYFKVH